MHLPLFSSSSPCLPTWASPCGFLARRYEENITFTQIRCSGNTFSARGVVVSCRRQGTYGTRYCNFVSLVTLKSTLKLLDLLFASLLDVSALSALVFILFSIFNIRPIPHAVDPAKDGNVLRSSCLPCLERRRAAREPRVPSPRIHHFAEQDAIDDREGVASERLEPSPRIHHFVEQDAVDDREDVASRFQRL